MEKEIIQIQLGLFFKFDYNDNFENFALKFKNKIGESKITNYIPVPSNMPGDIPRLILGYEKFNVNASKNRLDLFFKDLPSVNGYISNILDYLLTDLQLQIGRIGFVKNFFVEGDIAKLKKLLPKEDIDKLDLKEINIRINNKKNVDGYGCNDIENLANGRLIKKNIEGTDITKDGIIVTRDINTLQEDIAKNKFEKVQIVKIISDLDTETNILYFIAE